LIGRENLSRIVITHHAGESRLPSRALWANVKSRLKIPSQLYLQGFFGTCLLRRNSPILRSDKRVGLLY
jgi:hypothetical protein